VSRYRGPRNRIVRRLGTPLHGLTRHTPDERPYPPGQHGPARAGRRRRESAFKVRLQEKQKLRFYYGIRETQLRSYMRRSARRAGPTAENLLKTLERRLDNVVFRVGLAPTIPAARQLVTHGHVTLNGHRVNVPSLLTSVGDVIGVHERRGRLHRLIAEGIEHGPAIAVPSYLERSPDGRGGRVISEPQPEDVPIELNSALVVEYYAVR